MISIWTRFSLNWVAGLPRLSSVTRCYLYHQKNCRRGIVREIFFDDSPLAIQRELRDLALQSMNSSDTEKLDQSFSFACEIESSPILLRGLAPEVQKLESRALETSPDFKEYDRGFVEVVIRPLREI